ncbi:MAG: hypothetical protein E7311_07020 [Clostridiales bacterium]|nr:hypothetical protein [Clostridiales bacterium]
MNNIHEKRSVKSYLLSMFLVLIYIVSIFYTIWFQENFVYSIITIIINGILVLLTLKRSIIASLILVIMSGYTISFPTILKGFIEGNIEPLQFFISCLIILFFFAIFIDIIIEKGFEAKNKPKSSFYYTEKDYTPGNKK